MRTASGLALLFILAFPVAATAAAGDEGRLLYERQCAACHTIGEGDRIGPDLAGVNQRRPRDWLLGFVTGPDRMIAAGDPVAVRLYERYNRIVMPKLNLSEEQAGQLLEYLAHAAPAAATPVAPVTELPRPALAEPQSRVLQLFLLIAAVIVLVFTWVALSTRNPVEVDVHRAYSIRRVLFVIAVVALAGLLVLTLPKAPYARAGAEPARVVYVAARQFDFLFSEEPIVSRAEVGVVPTLAHLVLAKDELVEFRVTSIDVNHGFGLYGPDRQIVAQTQAMPGYFNRLLFRPAASGEYKVFCLEYCAAGHHLMQVRLTVN
jgi:heme/copper-type cytochrome/quinol oxidase subunit 2